MFSLVVLTVVVFRNCFTETVLFDVNLMTVMQNYLSLIVFANCWRVFVIKSGWLNNGSCGVNEGGGNGRNY